MYKLKNFSQILLGSLPDELLKKHFSLYEGYVKNTNKIFETLSKLNKESIEFAELKRRFGWEFNGMRLHELYFENMIPGKINKKSELFKKIEQEFKTFESWLEDFKATAIRGIGWVILYYDNLSGQLFNTWINEHDTGHLAACTPLLVMDIFEHAFMPAGIEKKDYIEIFISLIAWDVVEKRFKTCLGY